MQNLHLSRTQVVCCAFDDLDETVRVLRDHLDLDTAPPRLFSQPALVEHQRQKPQTPCPRESSQQGCGLRFRARPQIPGDQMANGQFLTRSRGTLLL